MKAILIDPFAKTVTELDFSGKFEHAYKLIECNIIEFSYVLPSHTLMIDEEGLFKNPQMPFNFNGYTFVGRALLTGGTSGIKPVTATIEEVRLLTLFPD